MKYNSLREKIISSIPQIQPMFWSYMDNALEEMSKVVWSDIHPNLLEYQPLAFATRSSGEISIFEVYVNQNIQISCQEPLKLHEFGHIIFSHLSLQETQRSIIIKKILSHWNVIKTFISDDILKDPDARKNAADVVANAVLNIAMDYEVNSKLFTDAEWDKISEFFTWATIEAMAHSESATKETLESALSWIEDKSLNKKPFAKGVHPKDGGYPEKLNYLQYIDLMLMQSDKMMEQIKNAIRDAQKISDEYGTSNSQPIKKLTKEDIEKLKKEYNDTNNVENTNLKKDADKRKAKLSKRESINNEGWSPVGHDMDNTKYKDISVKSLKDKLLKTIFNKHVLNIRQDSMYYYNRRKYDNNYLITKERVDELNRPRNIYLLVDCSGSIGVDSISGILNVVKDIAKSCGKNSRVIWWDTALAGDYSLSHIQPPETSGGTYISDGIKYVKSKYLKDINDKLIIVSDFYDALDMWYNELKDIKNGCVGICWETKYNRVSNLKEYLKQVNMYATMDESITNKLLKKMPTYLVSI